MDRTKIMKQVQDCFCEEFDDDEIVLTEETSPVDIDEWDSLAHLMIMHKVEQKFNLKFTMEEIQKSNTVGAIVDCVQKRQDN